MHGKSYDTDTGIIPADAGSTIAYLLSRLSHQDHPRGCGEHRKAEQERRQRIGSSPRMRGAHSPCSRHTGSNGIIPADAGSTDATRDWRPVNQDHPRGCGEHFQERTRSRGYSSSSPRMRGALSAISRSLCNRRIIPADAGSTRPSAGRASHGRDHPRGCGEHRGRAIDSKAG